MFFVKKKDGKLRLVQDYRQLNAVTMKNRYPLLLILELINKLQGVEYFTKFDVRWGFNNIRIREGDEWKAAFHTNQGLFEPTVMFFGLCNSPATFQTMMNDIFRELIIAGRLVVYMDDILIFSQTLQEHHDTVREVLRILQEYLLSLRLEKCAFAVQMINFLGLIISKNQLAMDPVKLKGISEWPMPKKKKDVQSFLGFVNFYRRFIDGFAKKAKPLHTLTGKEEWKWDTKHQESFEALKTALTTSPVL